jgi:hypothetical protein
MVLVCAVAPVYDYENQSLIMRKALLAQRTAGQAGQGASQRADI